MLKQFVAGVVVTVMLSGAAIAGPWEDGLAAYQRGDYAMTLKLCARGFPLSHLSPPCATTCRGRRLPT